MAYKEIKSIVRNVKKKMKRDEHRPYRVRKKTGAISRHGEQAYEYREVDQMLTQPLGNKEFSRLSDGDRRKTWRFAAIINPELLELGEQVEYKDDWFEVRKINDWDTIMSAQIVSVK